MKKMSSKRLFRLFFLFLLVLVNGCSEPQASVESPAHNKQEEYRVEDLELKSLLNKNLSSASQKDIEGYLATISKKGQEETRVAMTDFFENYDVTHTLLEFEVVERHADERVAKTSQKSEVLSESKEDEYKSHIAEVLHVFTKEENEWKISESSIVDVRFIE